MQSVNKEDKQELERRSPSLLNRNAHSKSVVALALFQDQVTYFYLSLLLINQINLFRISF